VGPREPGTVSEIGHGERSLKVIGNFTIGPGFEAGLLIVSDQTFVRALPPLRLDDVSVGLIKLRPGADVDRVATELRERLPPDVRLRTRAELRAHERHYWVVNTSTGIIFGSGVAVALLFGVVIIYQVLSLEVTNRLSEYATLKALGYSDSFLAFVVLQQAVIFAVLSYVPAYLNALVIYVVSNRLTNLPIGMTLFRASTVFFLSLLMCSFSGLMALRILRRADPVDLF
jgi:putative ABC transport system permease protein